MEHATALIVITLLQLCRAEISEILPGTWFSANGINDGYTPKPLLDLFSSEATPGFSPTKPIIVLPSSPPQPVPEVTHLSTASPTFYTSTSSQSSTSYQSSSTNTPTVTDFTVTHPRSSSIPPTPFETSSTPYPSSRQSTLSLSSSPEVGSITTTFAPPENLPIFNFPNSPQPAPNSRLTTLSDFINRNGKSQSYEVEGLLSTTSPLIVPLSKTTATPSFFVLYENTPSNPTQQITETSTGAPIPFSSLVTSKPLPPVTQTTDTITPYITNAVGTSRPTISFRSTPPPITYTSSTFTTPMSLKDFSSASPLNFTNQKRPNDARPIVYPGPPQRPFMPNLKIRIVAPQGSITNVKINPSTTTRRPTTKKPKKKNGNTHEVCVEHCKRKREHICAVPLGTLIVEPNMLKGFPSICHMACHNSFKKDPYEKIVDGRCSRIRTRIIRVDSKTKMHKEELKKSEYSIINTGPKAVVEIAGLNVSNRKSDSTRKPL